MQTWSSWKRFPDVQVGGHVEAPIGPGVYEVRHTTTGRVVAFGHAGNVANAISELKFDGGVSALARLFGREPLGEIRREVDHDVEVFLLHAAASLVLDFLAEVD